MHLRLTYGLGILLLGLSVQMAASAQNGLKYLSDIRPSDKHAAYFIPQDENTFRMGGVTYSHGFYIYTTQGPTRHGYAEFDVSGAYKTFSFILGTSPARTNLEKKGIFAVYLDGRRAVDKVIDPHGVPERMTLDVGGVKIIRFEIVEGEVVAGIAEPVLWTASQTPRESGDICPLKGDRPVKLTTDIRPYQQGPRHSTIVKEPVFNDGEKKSVTINSRTYDNGLLFDAHQGIMDLNICATHFNIGGLFSTLAFLYGPVNSGQGTIGKGWLTVKCDGRIVSELEVDEGDIVRKAVINVKGCHQLTFETENESGSLNIAATEITVYPEGVEPEKEQTSSGANAWPDVCKLMSTITPYAVGGGVTRENAVFDGKSEHITFSMGGTEFSEGIILRASSNVLDDNTRSHAIFNIENQFDYISFTNGWISKCGVLKNDTLRIYADDRIVFEMPQIATSPNKYFEVPVNRCAKLMFELRGRSALTHPAFGVADIVLYRGEPVKNDLFAHPVPDLPDQVDLIDVGAPYVHYVPTMKDWPDKIFYDGTTQRRYFDNGGERINKGFMLQTSYHFDLEMGPGSDPGVGVMSAGLGASLMVGTVGGVTISAVFPFGCLLALASGGSAMESSCAAFNTWGAYDYITFTVASLNPSTTNRKERLLIGGDGEVISELEVYEQMSPRIFTVPLNRCTQLMFWLDCGGHTSGKYVFYDLKLGRGEMPGVEMPSAGSSQDSHAPSVAASPEPYILPAERSPWTDIEWQRPPACNSQAINSYFEECHKLRTDIDKFHSSLHTDYQTVASYVQAADGSACREITLRSSYGEVSDFNSLIAYDRQVLGSIKNFKGRFTALAVSQTTAYAGLIELSADMFKYTKLIKQTASAMSALKKQLEALEGDMNAEIELIEGLLSAGLAVDGVPSDSGRVYIR